MKNYFCGWYFKCQSDAQTLAVIPAVHTANGVRSGSVQIISDRDTWNVPLSGQRLHMRPDVPCAVLGDNRFRQDGFVLSLHTPSLSAVGSVRFDALSPIRYDIMGPFRFVPFLECRHSVFSMRHRVTGRLRINETDYIFSDDAGYIEGDRGRSFPERYVWTQCCFAGGSLMLSAADIPLGPVRFTGIICVVLLRGREYRLATYLGAKIVRIGGGAITIRQGDFTLTAALLDKAARPLQAPVNGAMVRLVRENAACRARYLFTKGKETLLSLETANASFEYELE